MSKDLLTTLKDAGRLEFGAHIPAAVVRDALGLTYPEVGSKAEFDKLALLELGAVDYVRNHLLNEGKYLRGTNDGYRILLPSENAAQVEAYMSNADGKLRRALKLHRNTPKESGSPNDGGQTEARIHLKQQKSRHRPR